MRMGIRKKFTYVTLLGLGMSLLTGCKEKAVDYNVENETESTQEENGGKSGIGRGKKGLEQFADEPVWNSYNDSAIGYPWIVENAEGKEVSININDAEVTVPDVEEMYVVEVKEPEFDAAYKKQISERIFGDAEIYYNDLAHLPRQDIEKQREQCQELYQLAKEWRKIIYDDVEYFPKQYQFDPENAEGWRDILEQELLKYEQALGTAGSVYTPADEYDVDEYLGTYSGIDYELTFTESERVRKTETGRYINNKNEDGCFMNCRGKEISFRAKDIYQVCPEEVKGTEGLYYRNMGLLMENIGNLSEKEGEELARRFVDELKLDYPIYTNCESLGWWKGTDSGSDWRENYVSYGYIFYFDAGVDAVSFPQFGTQQIDLNFRKKKKEAEEPQYFMKAQVEVYVTDKGVIGMQAYHPIETVSISEGVDFLPLDAIKGIIWEQVSSNYEDFRFKPDKTERDTWVKFDYSLQFERLELIYFRVRNKENKGYYSYIPAWRLSGGFEYPTYIENLVLINAIDGSVIDFYDEA